MTEYFESAFHPFKAKEEKHNFILLLKVRGSINEKHLLIEILHIRLIIFDEN